MEDVGIVSAVADFNADESDYEAFGSWEEFDQTEFVGIESPQKEKNWEFEDTDWYENSWVYIPTSCYSTTCSLHVSFHGCYNTSDPFADKNLLREFAANNDIIVLYPSSFCQNVSGPYDNPDGSFEGIDDDYWLTQDGLYPQAIMAMICRLTSAEDDNDCPVADAATYLVQSSISLVMAYLMLSF